MDSGQQGLTDRAIRTLLDIEPLIHDASILLIVASIVRRGELGQDDGLGLRSSSARRVDGSVGSVLHRGRSLTSWEPRLLPTTEPIMIKLTSVQLTILASATSNKQGLATRPSKSSAAQIAKISTLFREHRLAKEILARTDAPIWREDDQGRRYALKILKAGRDRVLEHDVPTASDGVVNDLERSPAANFRLEPNSGSKIGAVIRLMSRPEGATMGVLTSATGWLPHTTRAALSGLRKKGLLIAREQGESESIYRIAGDALRRAF